VNARQRHPLAIKEGRRPITNPWGAFVFPTFANMAPSALMPDATHLRKILVQSDAYDLRVVEICKFAIYLAARAD